VSDDHPVTTTAAQEDSDNQYLRQLGVEPRLRRALGFLTGTLFAVAFQGPTTGALLITAATLAFGGPAFIWSIVIIFALQLLLAVTWAELSSHYPLTGGIYQWARRLGGGLVGWMTGLFYVVAIILVMPAVGFAMNIVLSGLFSSITLTLGHEVIISIITTVVAAMLMAASVRIVAIINSIGVALELAVLLIAAIALFAHAHQPVSVVGQTGGVQGTGSYFWPFAVVVALVVTQLVGFETAGAFAEETKTARIKPSQAIIAGLSGTALVLFIFDLALLLALPNVHKAMLDPNMIPDTMTAVLGSGFAKLFFAGAMVSVFSTAIATLATIVRMIYGMARNNQLPATRFLTRLSPRTDEPLGTIAVAALASLVPLIFIKRIPVIIAAITALIIIPYILVLVSLLVRRLRGWPPLPSRFSLGRWGLPITVAGIVWTVVVLWDAAWPRAATNPNLGPLPVIEDLGLGVLVVGLLWWFVSLRRETQEAPQVQEPAGPG
jgi:amino acid transporter